MQNAASFGTKQREVGCRWLVLDQIGDTFFADSVGSLLSNVDNNLMKSVDNEVSTLPLQKQINHLNEELDNCNKLIKTLEVELKEKDEQLKMLKERISGNLTPGNVGVSSASSTSTTSPPSSNQSPSSDNTVPAESSVDPSIPLPPSLDGAPPPPPPMLDGVPLPPGPPGAPSPSAPKKKMKKLPSNKMKQLQWTKLHYNKIKGTVFEKFPAEYRGIPVEYDLLEESFAAKVIEKKEKEDKKQVHLLEHKTAQNLCMTKHWLTRL